MANPTMSDVAERAGVSKATVSAVINDADTVSTSTRKQVRTVIDDMNYRPRASARRGFQSSREKSLGLIMKEVDNPYYASVIAGARAYANECGYALLAASSEGDYDAEQQIVDVFKSKDVDGLIVVPVMDGQTDLSYLFDLKRRNFPFVLLESIQGVQANLVDIDNVAAARMAAEHLLGQGHKRIAHFAGPGYSMHSQERVDGIRQAYSELQLAFDSDRVVPTGARLKDGYEKGLTYFGEHVAEERPTAVICYNDLVAIGLMRALRELEIDVPGTVSVIGCDNIDLLDYLSLPLTSIHVPKREMGRKAADILIRHVEADDKIEPERVHLEARLAERQTTRAPDGQPAVS